VVVLKELVRPTILGAIKTIDVECGIKIGGACVISVVFITCHVAPNDV
jgi:hypothetical protein